MKKIKELKLIILFSIIIIGIILYVIRFSNNSIEEKISDYIDKVENGEYQITIVETRKTELYEIYSFTYNEKIGVAIVDTRNKKENETEILRIIAEPNLISRGIDTFVFHESFSSEEKAVSIIGIISKYDAVKYFEIIHNNESAIYPVSDNFPSLAVFEYEGFIKALEYNLLDKDRQHLFDNSY